MNKDETPRTISAAQPLIMIMSAMLVLISPYRAKTILNCRSNVLFLPVGETNHLDVR